MISVCIPVFNTDVNGLIKSLAIEIKRHSITCEIVVLDDGSAEAWKAANNEITKLAIVNYHQLPENRGRVEARKQLASLARYEWLLFIDADSKLINDDFLTTYRSHCTAGNDVIIGGRVYNSTPPQQCNQTLHWKYGSERETFHESRFNFMTNNFCIRKYLFLQLNFPEVFKGYGHEDTWIGIQLKQLNARMVQIENPVLHEGVEEAAVFLEKSKQALLNLMVLQQLVPAQTIQQHVKLYRYYILQKKLGLSGVIQWIDNRFHHQIEKNLASCKPSLILFDFYRLAYFIRLQKKFSLRKD